MIKPSPPITTYANTWNESIPWRRTTLRRPTHRILAKFHLITLFHPPLPLSNVNHHLPSRLTPTFTPGIPTRRTVGQHLEEKAPPRANYLRLQNGTMTLKFLHSPSRNQWAVEAPTRIPAEAVPRRKRYILTWNSNRCVLWCHQRMRANSTKPRDRRKEAGNAKEGVAGPRGRLWRK